MSHLSSIILPKDSGTENPSYLRSLCILLHLFMVAGPSSWLHMISLPCLWLGCPLLTTEVFLLLALYRGIVFLLEWDVSYSVCHLSCFRNLLCLVRSADDQFLLKVKLSKLSLTFFDEYIIYRICISKYSKADIHFLKFS